MQHGRQQVQHESSGMAVRASDAKQFMKITFIKLTAIFIVNQLKTDNTNKILD